ncbi:MAG: chorismate mutase [Sphingomonas sp.]|uniref:chorismate mutase n=1 Tax=Sphingomonas sp. TaxID=28214 RepID=UPI001AC90AC9|nr:chorismate mutase [Sphingomonas sp.]MBN8816959.1 chorismate mutase [Sphingomonas sp.]
MTDAPRDMIAPEDCQSMAEVRAGIDALDLQIVEMLAIRFRFMTAAARIKADRGAVRDGDRKAQVIANARAAAERAGIPADVIGDIWERLVEGSIAFEFDRWDEHRT